MRGHGAQLGCDGTRSPPSCTVSRTSPTTSSQPWPDAGAAGRAPCCAGVTLLGPRAQPRPATDSATARPITGTASSRRSSGKEGSSAGSACRPDSVLDAPRPPAPASPSPSASNPTRTQAAECTPDRAAAAPPLPRPGPRTPRLGRGRGSAQGSRPEPASPGEITERSSRRRHRAGDSASAPPGASARHRGPSRAPSRRSARPLPSGGVRSWLDRQRPRWP